MNPRASILAAAVVSALALAPAAGAASPEAAPATAKATHIATVNGQKIGADEYQRLLATTMRQKFYHGKAPEAEVEQVKRDVAETLVDRVLVLAEADRRGLKVDEGEVQRTLEGYEKQYASSPQWQGMRERVLPDLRKQLENQQRLGKIEAEVRGVGEPGEAAVRAFYEANPKLFTEPEKQRLSVIMLRVDPSARKAVRDQARAEGRAIHERLQKGADFAELAKIHSADPSGAKGGQIDTIHRGQLGEELQKQLDELKPGEFTPSLDVLEGVAIFKLNERIAPTLHDFEKVRARAKDLLQRERSEAAWKQFVARLRRDAKIEMEASWVAADKTRAP